MVPVLRDADKKGLAEIEQSIGTLVLARETGS